MTLENPTPIPMQRRIYSMKVESIIDHTPEIRELILKTPQDPAFHFRCGQFVMLHLPNPAGGKDLLRAYSIASDEKEKNYIHLIFKFVPSGAASTFVWNLKGGETLNFTGPFGKLFFQEPPTEQIVFLNTGSGVSQHICYLASKLEQYPNLQYRMYFGVRTEKDIYYEDCLIKLKNKLPNFQYYYVLSRVSDTSTLNISTPVKSGYVQHYLKELDYKNTPTTFYLCGNGQMIKEVKHQLLEIDGLKPQQIWAEAFD